MANVTAVERTEFDPPLPIAASGEPVSRLAVADEARLPDELRRIFARFREHYGFVPNWLKALAVNPGTALRMVRFYEHLFDPRQSALTAAERELIAVVTSATNHCAYCVFNHTQALGTALDDRVRARRIAQGFRHVRLSPRELALAEVVETLAEAPQHLGDPDLDRLRDEGFDQAAIVEILEVAAFFAYANRLTIALNVVPDAQFFAA
ncbi:MAG TPA: peroxidase-related enzyme [Geminicoccus sp.]|uniref:peroxidase-related enzyme n=1 Tax=Geminicoccus sp. TaxID=2024832 RepID=UPI002B67C8B3|nr:peroxidase-related enzyme [Geminicoccus sp.]HWL71943.1 peroxidase-related enzyme [Geminicoccus sp.]